MRPGRGLGMILHTENSFLFVPNSLDSLVVQVDPVHADLRRQRCGIDGETVILRGDFDAAGLEVLHRLIAAPMAELQLERFAAKRLAQDLVPEANTENWHVRLDEITDGFDGVTQRRWIARTIRKK